MKRYWLQYYPMCGIDGSVDWEEKARKRGIEAEDDLKAVETANWFLKENYKGTSTIPWAPMLWDDEGKLVATSEASCPPKAHYLAWMLANDRTLIEVISA